MSKRANGEGSVYRRNDGRWVATLTLNGRRKSFYAATQRDARARLQDAQRRIEDGGPVADSRSTVAAFLRRWLDVGLPAAGLKQSTADNYAIMVRRHLIPALGNLPLDRLRASDIEAMLLAKADLSDSTRRLIYTVTRRALDYAVRDGLLRSSPAATVPRPRVRHRDARVLTPEQAQHLLDVARGDRLYVLIAVALGAGLRRGEALALRWSDLDLDAGTLRVSRTLSRTSSGLIFTEPKSARSRRTVPIPDALVTELRAHRRRQAAERLRAGSIWREYGLIFPSEIGTPAEPRNVLRAFQAIATRAGLPGGIGLHSLRHSCASLLLAQGVPLRVIMETLGHSGLSITADTYAHVMPAQQREAAERMASALTW